MPAALLLIMSLCKRPPPPRCPRLRTPPPALHRSHSLAYLSGCPTKQMTTQIILTPLPKMLATHSHTHTRAHTQHTRTDTKHTLKWQLDARRCWEGVKGVPDMATYCAMFYATRTTKQTHILAHTHTLGPATHSWKLPGTLLSLSHSLSVCPSLCPSVHLSPPVCLSDCPFVAPVCSCPTLPPTPALFSSAYPFPTLPSRLPHSTQPSGPCCTCVARVLLQIAS